MAAPITCQHILEKRIVKECARFVCLALVAPVVEAELAAMRG